VLFRSAEWPVFDGRYAIEIAKANNRIAKWESFTLGGQRQRKHVVVPVSPYPQIVPMYVSPEDQSVEISDKYSRYLFSFEYEKNGERLIAIANAWDDGECFVRLRIFELDPATEYTLTEPEQNRVFTNKNGDALFSADELSKGVTVHVGAMRWGAFLLRPKQSVGAIGDYRPILPSETAIALKARLDRLSGAVINGKRRWDAGKKAAQAQATVSKLAADFSDRICVVNETSSPPKIDGALEDSCWQDTAAYGDFRLVGTRQNPRYQTTWSAVRSGKMLYLGVQCLQDMRSPVALATVRDGRVWRDDSVEVFLNKIGSKGYGNFVQFIVNPTGTVLDMKDMQKGWNEIQKLAVLKTKTGWSFEVAIPLDKIGINPEDDRVIKINVVRNVIGSEFNQAESSSWYPVWGSNNDFRARGIMIVR